MVNQKPDALYFFKITADLFAGPATYLIGLIGSLVHDNLLFNDNSGTCAFLSAILVSENMNSY